MVVDTQDKKIPKGYKQTEVGVIPEDWEVKELGDCLVKSPRYGIGAPAVEYSDKLPIYIRITDISEDGRFSPEKKVSVENCKATYYFLYPGDVVVARTGASVGKSYAYRPKDGRLVFAGFLICITPENTILLSQYLANYLQTDSYWSWVKLMSMRSGQPGINSKEYTQLHIPLPRVKEQTAIASVLSDVDTLIEKLEKLIAKKRAIKQGAMQELLTGKRRLPGFGEGMGYKQTEVGVIPEDWDIHLIQKLIDERIIVGHLDGNHGELYPKTHEFKQYGVPYVAANNLENGRVNFGACKFLSEERAARFRKGRAKNGDVLFAHNATVGPVALVSTKLNCVILSTTVTYFRSDPAKLYNAYLLYSLQSPSFVKQYRAVMSQSTRNQVPITAQRKFKIVLPSTINEQTAIASVLSDVDTEIEMLEKKLTKYRLMKQGMMQVLLTGKIRLVTH
jgi:type I restriction enzyme, S subunit